MKRLLSIFFAIVLVFNLAGYRLFIHWLQEKQAISFTQKINSGVDEQDLISVKVPAALPYYANAKDFQWVDGEVAIDGVVYQYVKRRIYNDSIEFLCLKNGEKTRLQNARDQFFQLAHNLQSTKEKSSSLPQVKPLLLEYCSTGKAFELNSYAQPLFEKLEQHTGTLLPEEHAYTPEQPPEYSV